MFLAQSVSLIDSGEFKAPVGPAVVVSFLSVASSDQRE